MSDHAGRPRRWRPVGDKEGSCLVDAVGLAELLGREFASSEDLRAGAIEALDRDLDRCPHGLRLWADLAGGEPFEVRPGLVLGRDLDLLAGLAMGSGRAPWTRGGLEALEWCRPAGLSVADVGTGTGILGLYALRLGAARVDAVDVDDLAVAVARRNGRANGLADRFDVRLGSIEALSPPYDLLVLAPPELRRTVELLPVAAKALGPGGWIILAPAGGPDERIQLDRLIRELGLEPCQVVDVEGWETLIARRVGA